MADSLLVGYWGLVGGGDVALVGLACDSTPCSAAVESAGAARAEAQARAEAARIEGEAAILQAKLKAEAVAIETVRSKQGCGGVT